MYLTFMKNKTFRKICNSLVFWGPMALKKKISFIIEKFTKYMYIFEKKHAKNFSIFDIIGEIFI